MQPRSGAILAVILVVAISLWASPLAAQPLKVSQSHDVDHEVYAPSVTPAIYLVNFLLLYMANPELIEDANPCQESGEPACLIETTCAGKLSLGKQGYVESQNVAGVSTALWAVSLMSKAVRETNRP